ncbi:hypothetical protein KC363_g2260 [Hortaea werneckii]|nr:hypothetical protein KC325_g2973 [Hortaea werneckii]KAI6995934.1 hypothetical protein KC359_g3790 [Hortaea werneckii]KAI7084645.1 hypothetical protein KC356_g6543 [Hortaea werneckii]KAI7147568.1 hypothetical protein KC344_g2705 [Hortaea werneckii]KAI7176486.1 hypothetical protein KC360_g2983 [Hortaea werneckii]
MNILADQGSSMEQQKSTDVLLMELMGLALGWDFAGASEHRALVKRLYQAAQEERKAAHSRFLHLQEKQAFCEKEVDSLRAKLASMEAATKDSHHAETGKKTLNEVEVGNSNRDSKRVGRQQSLQGTGVASKSSSSANDSVDGEAPSVESSDPRKRRKTSQATFGSLPSPLNSTRAAVSPPATQPQTLPAGNRLGPHQQNSTTNFAKSVSQCVELAFDTDGAMNVTAGQRVRPVDHVVWYAYIMPAGTSSAVTFTVITFMTTSGTVRRKAGYDL